MLTKGETSGYIGTSANLPFCKGVKHTLDVCRGDVTDESDESMFKSYRSSKNIDYGYHFRPSPERCAWQDWLIESITYKTPRQSSPLVIFTAGAMAVGKGYVMEWLSERGYFPIEKMGKFQTRK